MVKWKDAIVLYFRQSDVLLKKQQNKWDEYLQLLAGAIRATPSRQTGFFPNFLMFGREVTQPIDLTFGILTANRKDKDIVVEYV
jgi:hypothetical protein